ncbi:unnamed protein product [Prorocentrum cordatum]|uniref:Solute carrier family 40 protein n=1 Tax=Prorocentrum cordatum TaxID=2364126 RepID=A0ABN9XHC7_9DINO|nr:unnamed protein product [Polarella glacialis]
MARRTPSWAAAAGASLQRDLDAGVIQISMMGFQGQAVVVGSAVTLVQSVYLVQFGARASVMSGYLALVTLVSVSASCAAVAALVGLSMRHSRSLFLFGCFTSLLASLALTLPPTLYQDPERQATFLSHYFGVWFVVGNVGAKFRDYPVAVARVWLLRSTEDRASEHAYTRIFDIILGNGLNGALMLSLLAHPSAAVQFGLVALQVASTAVSLQGGSALASLREDSRDPKPAVPAKVFGAPSFQPISCEKPQPRGRTRWRRSRPGDGRPSC